jgi:hypothetical protein
VVSDPTGSHDLTAEGTLDWAHFGLQSETSVEHRNGTALIGALTIVGTGPLHQYTDNHLSFSWTNGTPVASNSGTTTGVLIYGAGNGFSIDVPADQTVRTLRIYMSGFGADYRVVGHISDGSAYDYDVTILHTVNDAEYRMFTFSYKSLMPGQYLRVTWTDLKDYFGGANVTVQAVTLQ